MNAAIVCELQNLMGQLVQAYAANQLSLRLKYLTARDDFKMRLPGFAAFSDSIEEAVAELRDQEQRYEKDGQMEFALTHTPMFDLQETTAKGNWDAYVMRVNSAKQEARLLSAKIEVRFAATQDGWRISALDWQTIYAHVPHLYTEKPKLAAMLELPVSQPVAVDPQTWYAARNLQSFFTHNARTELAEWISVDCVLDLDGYGVAEGACEVLSLLAQMNAREAENGVYLCVPLVTAPWIRTSAFGAEGRWLVQTFEMGQRREGFVQPIVRRLGVIESSFVWQDGRLLLQQMTLKTVAELPTLEYDHAMVMPHLMQHDTIKWYYHSHTQNTQHADAIAEVENLFVNWVGSMRSGNLHRYPARYINDEKAPVRTTLDSPLWKSEETMDAAGYQRWAEALDATWIPNEFTYHGILTPEILPNEDGSMVEAHWIDHSMTNATMVGRPSMVFVANYTHEFTKVDGTWYQSGFGWEPLLGVPDYRYDPENTEGALQNGGSYDYRMPLEFHHI